MLHSKPWPKKVLACFFAFVVTTGMVTLEWVLSFFFNFAEGANQSASAQAFGRWLFLIPVLSVGLVVLIFARRLVVGIPLLVIVALISAFQGLMSMWKLAGAPIGYYFVPLFWVILPALGCALLLSRKCREFFAASVQE